MFPFTRAAQNKATVQERLAAVELEIAAATAQLEHDSLDAVLSDDPVAGKAAMNRLADLKLRRELLLAAIREAEAQERAEQDALAAKEFAARKRALSQHIGRFQRDQADVTAALVALRNAFRALTETGQSIVSVLPASMRNQSCPFNELLDAPHLRELCNLEALRLSRDCTVVAPGVQSLPMLLPQYEDRTTGAIPKLENMLAEMLVNCRREFEARGPAKPQSSPPDTTQPVLSVPASVDVSSSAPADAARRALGSPGEVIDLSGKDLGVPKTVASVMEEETADA